MKNFIKILTVAAILQALFISPAFAADDCGCVCDGNAMTSYDRADCTGRPAKELCACTIDSGNGNGDPSLFLKNPLGETTSIPLLIGNIIKAALGIVGSLALIMFIYGGFTWMLAAGNEQAVTKGKNILVWATVGLAVIFASYSLVNFIINSAIKGGG